MHSPVESNLTLTNFIIKILLLDSIGLCLLSRPPLKEYDILYITFIMKNA